MQLLFRGSDGRSLLLLDEAGRCAQAAEAVERRGVAEVAAHEMSIGGWRA